MGSQLPHTPSDLREESNPLLHYYSKEEEMLNVITHGLGFGLSILGTFFLIKKAIQINSKLYFWSCLIFGISLMSLYAASTLYHSAKNPLRRRWLNIVDHAAIYVLIAGSYTPFCLITLKDSYGFALFCVVWSFALLGVVLKLFYTGKYDRLSTIMYVLMGWLALFVVKPLISNLDSNGLYLLVAGGVIYTLGALIYSIKSLKYNHAVFHVFVMLGSLCHYWVIYRYV